MLVCIIVAFPFIVGMIRYGEGIPGDNLGDYFDNRILVWHNGKRGYIDRLGREVIPIKYDAINYFSGCFSRIISPQSLILNSCPILEFYKWLKGEPHFP